MMRPLCLIALAPLLTLAACSASSSDSDLSAAGYGPGGSESFSADDAGTAYEDTGTTSPGSDAGSFGSVGTGGGQDFGFFRKALADGKIPSPDSIDAAGFFAEHYTSLPDPTCGKTFCLHGMLSVSEDLARGGDWTLLQMGMNSPIDPATVKKPALDLAVVLDRSGSMGDAGKMAYAKEGLKLLVDALGPDDKLTFIAFSTTASVLYGPAPVTDKTSVKSLIDSITPGGGTNLYDGLQTGYQAIEKDDEEWQRRVIFLTDGLASEGDTIDSHILDMSAGYNKKHLGLTTIGLGTDVSIKLLRGLAEQGSGNFYYIEKLDAVKEVFTEEMAFFVAPIAYDLELTYTQMPSYSTTTVYGTNLWKSTAGGGSIFIPSVFLVSRTSSAPDPSGGRRGGGSAIIAELKGIGAMDGLHDVAKLNLKYRLPGTTTYESQELSVQHSGTPGKAPDGGYYSDPSIEKNEIILSIFIAFRDATAAAQTDKSKALAILEPFQTKIVARLAGWTDEDLADDLKILQQYIDVLKK
ncbi:MAG: vWA domain-containing protein [Polyangiales bacterium]